MNDATAPRPIVMLEPGQHKRAAGGHPWIYSNELRMDRAAKELPPGSLVALEAADGRSLGAATFNPHALIAARLLDRDPQRPIDRRFFAAKLESALKLRERLYPEPYYRLDPRRGGRASRRDPRPLRRRCWWRSSIARGWRGSKTSSLPPAATRLEPAAIVLRNDSPARALEGLPSEVRVAAGEIAGPVELVENGARFLVDPQHGQKTGWFYDQRENRRFVAGLCRGRARARSLLLRRRLRDRWRRCRARRRSWASIARSRRSRSPRPRRA